MEGGSDEPRGPRGRLERAFLAAALIAAALTVLEALAIRPHRRLLVDLPLALFWVLLGVTNLVELRRTPPAGRPLQALLGLTCLFAAVVVALARP